jgi:t-SNARE complex subunit (syntaxin)
MKPNSWQGYDYNSQAAYLQYNSLPYGEPMNGLNQARQLPLHQAIASLEQDWQREQIDYNFRTEQYNRMKRDYEIAQLSPKQKELDAFPALNNAWEQYVMVRKMVIGQ